MEWIIAAVIGLLAVLAASAVRSLTVMPGTIALLYRKGRFVRELDSGFHRWPDPMRTTVSFVFPTTRQTLTAHEVTVMTRDQFSFRVAFTPIVEITDARIYYEAKSGVIGDWRVYMGLYFAELDASMAAAAIEQVSKQSLEEFLADPLAIAAAVRERIGEATPGAAVLELLVTAITMPPEIRKMFTEVERAKRESLAALERARGEQASLRALANAARALQSNPELARLRTLQTTESARGNKTFVLGQGSFSIDPAASSD